jgi:ATP-binding protein involved in chromosome partitioning
LFEVEPSELFEDEQAVRERVLQRLADVGRIVVVMSGKGGVGKTCVSVNLAVALAQRGRSVGLFDADLNGPSVAKMLGLRGQPVRVSGAGDLGAVPGPVGLRVQSMDFFLQGNQALDWDGPSGQGAAMRSGLEQSATADLLGRTVWGALDLLVIDLAPGADRLPALSRFLPATAAAVVVTIPSQIALMSVDRSLRRARELRFPLIGLVENLGTSICAKCGAEQPLFRDTLDSEISDMKNGLGTQTGLQLEVLAQIPFDRDLAADADAGRVFLEGKGRGSIAGRALCQLAAHVDAYEQPGPEGESW